MHLKRSFAVIGGDLRQRCLLRQLRGLGFPASMPAGGGVPLADILDAAEPDALVCGGMLGPAEELLLTRGISFFDYAKDEALLLQNAELTAEAALALLLERLPGPLAGSRILHVLDAVPAEQQIPVRLRVRVILADQSLVDRRGLVKFTVPPQMRTAVE